MKKDNKQRARSKREAKKVEQLGLAQNGLTAREANTLVIGIDLGDVDSAYCARRRADQEIITEGTVKTTVAGMHKLFSEVKRQRFVLETGTHSRWVAELLQANGHDVVVANARKLKLISENNQKSDKVDAQLLSELGCVKLDWLHPVHVRNEDTHSDLLILRAREALVGMRTGLINHVRGTVKSFGCRVGKCGSERFAELAHEQMPEKLKPALGGVLSILEELDNEIHGYDCQIEQLCETKYAEATGALLQVAGVGPVTSLCFVLTLEDPHRFEQSRDVGPYLGLVRKQRQSGARDPRLGISKEGDPMLRKLLVNCAHHILGVHGADSDLRRWGLGLVRAVQRKGTRGARKLAAAAVARKLCVLLHRLWVTGAKYEPLRNSGGRKAATAA